MTRARVLPTILRRNIINASTSAATSSRPFVPGTTGWTARDLDDPAIEREWFRGRYEIIEGVLAELAPGYFAAGRAVVSLLYKVVVQVGESAGDFACGVDIVMDEMRVVRADAAFLTPFDEKKQIEAARIAGRIDPNRTRILIPPTLVIESMSPGHEFHDQRTKRRWYAEFGIPNYWVLNSFDHSLQCLTLDGNDYREDAAGRDQQEVRPSLFTNLVIALKELWAE